MNPLQQFDVFLVAHGLDPKEVWRGFFDDFEGGDFYKYMQERYPGVYVAWLAAMRVTR